MYECIRCIFDRCYQKKGCECKCHKKEEEVKTHNATNLTERKGSYTTVTAFKPLKIEEDKVSVIPIGIYCYDENGVCPYWSLKGYRNGYCKFLDIEDDQIDGLGLLWDQCKECGINMSYEDENPDL
jgi:hypothetical protein